MKFVKICFFVSVCAFCWFMRQVASREDADGHWNGMSGERTHGKTARKEFRKQHTKGEGESSGGPSTDTPGNKVDFGLSANDTARGQRIPWTSAPRVKAQLLCSRLAGPVKGAAMDTTVDSPFADLDHFLLFVCEMFEEMIRFRVGSDERGRESGARAGPRVEGNETKSSFFGHRPSVVQRDIASRREGEPSTEGQDLRWQEGSLRRRPRPPVRVDTALQPEGRGRRRDHRMFAAIVMGFMIMASILIPMGFQFLTVLGGKSLLMAKMALIMSAISGLKKIATSNVGYGFYHTGAESHHHDHHGHHGFHDKVYRINGPQSASTQMGQNF